MPGLLGNALAAHRDAVIAKICACPGCKRCPEKDTTISYAFTFADPAEPSRGSRLLFIPHELGMREHFTVDQLTQIEKSLSLVGIDLLPLDINLLH